MQHCACHGHICNSNRHGTVPGFMSAGEISSLRPASLLSSLVLSIFIVPTTHLPHSSRFHIFPFVSILSHSSHLPTHSHHLSLSLLLISTLSLFPPCPSPSSLLPVTHTSCGSASNTIRFSDFFCDCCTMWTPECRPALCMGSWTCWLSKVSVFFDCSYFQESCCSF